MINPQEIKPCTIHHTAWQVDLHRSQALHVSGFTACFCIYAGQERLPFWIMTGICGGQSWLGHPGDLPGGMEGDEIHALMREGAMAFLEALEEEGLG